VNNLDWGLIIFLIAISGFIAFVGNYVGRRAGKRRISILGIRPYYTSMIITVLTGIIITTVTLITLISVSSSMRSALENKAQLQETIKLLSQRLSVTESELSIRASELSAAIEYQKKLEKSIKEQNERVKELEKKLKETEEEIKNREIALGESKAQLKELDKQREHLIKMISELNKEVEQLKREKNSLLQENTQLKDKLNKLGKVVSSLEEQRKILNNKLELYSSELAELKKEINDYKAQAKELKKEIKQKESQLNLLRHQKILFYGGEVVLAETINGPKSEQEAKDSLKYMIERAEEIVRYRYLHSGESVPDKDTPLISYDPSELESAIRSLKEEQRLIRIRVRNNTFVYEPIYVTIESLKSRLIFSKDETIVFKFISAKLPRNKIIEELDILLSEVRKEGIRRGMIIDHLTNPISNVSYETLLGLSVRIKVNYMKFGSTLVVVKAEREIYTGGPLRIKFELR